MPWTEAEGWVDFEISLDGGPFYWKGRLYVGKKECCMNDNVILYYKICSWVAVIYAVKMALVNKHVF
jgi:hypothetical protein